MEAIRISKFKKGSRVFLSTGISKVKVTQDGQVVMYEIPIQSTGISELVDSFTDNAPKPPLVNHKADPADPDDQIAKDMGFTKKQWVKIPNLGDPDYLKAVDEHNQDMGMAILLRGLAIDVEDEEGKAIEDADEKLEVLKEMGMSGDQFGQVISDIQDLTQWQEGERELFLDDK